LHPQHILYTTPERLLELSAAWEKHSQSMTYEGGQPHLERKYLQVSTNDLKLKLSS